MAGWRSTGSCGAQIWLDSMEPMNRAQLEKIAKALADSTRLRILEEISSRPQMTCGDIVSMRGVTPATVSHHLKILYDVGLIDCHKKGQFVYSWAVPETIQAYSAALAKVVRKKKRKMPR
jgi:ArsR family transcriptional regulator